MAVEAESIMVILASGSISLADWAELMVPLSLLLRWMEMISWPSLLSSE